MVAADGGHLAVVKALLEAGSDINIKNKVIQPLKDRKIIASISLSFCLKKEKEKE